MLLTCARPGFAILGQSGLPYQLHGFVRALVQITCVPGKAQAAGPACAQADTMLRVGSNKTSRNLCARKDSIHALQVCQYADVSCGGFTAGNQHGYLQVDVANTGYIPASYTVTVGCCSPAHAPVEFASPAGNPSAHRPTCCI